MLYWSKPHASRYTPEPALLRVQKDLLPKDAQDPQGKRFVSHEKNANPKSATTLKRPPKPAYNLWQNIGYMLRLAWAQQRSVPVLCLLLAVFAAAKAAAELLLAPTVLGTIEQGQPLATVLQTVALFVVGLLVLAALLAYINQNTRFARTALRTQTLAWRLAEKLSTTSYPNTLDTSFIELKNKAYNTIEHNWSAAEDIWTTWTALLTDLLGFALYLVLLSQCSVVLMLFATVMAIVGYFVGNRIHEWGYRHREEEGACLNKMYYIHGCATNRAYAKDIRIFSLQHWLLPLWEDALRRYRAFVGKREGMAMWVHVLDAGLALLRGGAAYGILLWITLAQGLPVSQFLLYFSAITGFTKWVTGILDGFSALHRQSLELCSLREFLDWPEPFAFAEGQPLPSVPDGRYELRL